MPSQETLEVRFGDVTIIYEVVRSQRRRKTVKITVDPVDGVRVAAPERASQERLSELVRRRAPWILRHLNEDASAYLPRPPHEFVSGESFEYLGRQARLQVMEVDGLPRAEVRLLPGRFEVKVRAGLGASERKSQVAQALERWYRSHAISKIKQRVDVLGKRLGVQPSAVLVRNQETRWGSCSPNGVLRFNWRIVMSPLSLVDYVVAHELCHLLHPDHGRAFWNRLVSLIPDCELRRQRLRKEGARYRL